MRTLLLILALSPLPLPVFAANTDLVIYHVYVGTFRDGDRGNDGEIRGWKDAAYSGGDLLGVIESLDYIRKVGANAVWLSPVFAARTSHGYDVTNYWRIGDAVGVAGDPKASLELFRRLVKEAHARGIKVVLDIPLNHASRQYDTKDGDPLGLKPKSTGPQQPAEKLWESWNSGYRYWNFDDANTRKFLVEAALHWIRDEGVDGLRLDYVRGVPHDFWSQLDAAVKAVRPDAFLVGECWMDDQPALANVKEIATYYGPAKGGEAPQFDALLDFPVQDALVDVFARGGAATTLADVLKAEDAVYPQGATPAFFLDNHDLARFSDWNGDPRRLVAALTFMASLSGENVVFYGTETGLSGSRAKPGFTDSGRLPMPWGKLDEALIGRVAQVFATRAGHPALSRGARRIVSADRTTLLMTKRDGNETLLVAVNTADQPKRVPVEGVTKALLGGAKITVDDATKKAMAELPPLSTSILAP